MRDELRLTPSLDVPAHAETVSPRLLQTAFVSVAAFAGFAVAWWLDNASSVYLERILSGLLLCL